MYITSFRNLIILENYTTVCVECEQTAKRYIIGNIFLLQIKIYTFIHNRLINSQSSVPIAKSYLYLLLLGLFQTKLVTFGPVKSTSDFISAGVPVHKP